MAAGTSSPSNSLSKLTVKEEGQGLINQCPGVCLRELSAPIFMCVTGHSICEKCKDKLSKCPTCQSKWSERRNFTLEKVLEILPIPCRYKEDGCEIVQTGEQMKEHIKTCRFKPGKCPCYGLLIVLSSGKPVDSSSTKCEVKSIKESKVKKHLLDFHGFTEIGSNVVQQTIKIRSPNSKRYFKVLVKNILNFDQKDFILTLMREESNSYRWVISVIGSREEEGCYRAEIDLQPGTKESTTWKIPVLSTYGRTILSFMDENQYKPGCNWKELEQMTTKCEDQAFDLTYRVSISKYEKVLEPCWLMSPLTSTN